MNYTPIQIVFRNSELLVMVTYPRLPPQIKKIVQVTTLDHFNSHTAPILAFYRKFAKIK